MERQKSTTDKGRQHHASVKKKKESGKLLQRAVTILIMAPLTFFLISISKFFGMSVTYLVVCISSMEWSGLKRHLKVAILHKKKIAEPRGTVVPLHLPHAPNQSTLAPSEHLNEETDSVTGARQESPMNSSEEEGGDGFDSPLLNLDVKQFDLPVPTLTRYNVMKHLAWAFLCVAAACGELQLLTLFICYFLLFVGVTIIAHNHLEMKVEEALDNLTMLRFSSNKSSPTKKKSAEFLTPNESSLDAAGVRQRGQAPSSREGSPRTAHSDAAARSAEDFRKREKERFRRLELSVIVDNQPAEQFVDFCLDIFGILWIAGMTTPLLVYNRPSIGFSWIVATMVGNFMNDIMALVTGRTVKAIVNRYFDGGRMKRRSSSSSSVKTHHRTTSSGVSTDLRQTRGEGSSGASSPSPPVGFTGHFLRFWQNAPHPLYEAISPNKSIEGAVAGILTNSIAFAVTLSLLRNPTPASSGSASRFNVFALIRQAVDALPSYWPESHVGNASVVEEHYRYNCFPVWVLVGLLMGIAGVVGDLLQSLLKRVSRVKDAGNILPGHGGMLDRIDGMLITFPLMYIALQIITALQ